MAKKPFGRPSKLTPAVRKKAEWYVNGGYIECDDAVPSIAGLSVELGVNRSTVQDWGGSDDAFSGTLARLKSIQERVSVSKGLKGEFNAAITKLLLANHGYAERTDNTHTHSLQGMSDEELKAIIEGANQ